MKFKKYKNYHKDNKFWFDELNEDVIDSFNDAK
jgi:hypothetical protein